MSNAGRYGFKKSSGFNLGRPCRMQIVVSLLRGFFLSALPLHSLDKAVYAGPQARIYPAASLVGGRDKPHGNGGSLTRTNSVFTEWILQFINIKGILYGVTAMSSFILPYYKSFSPVSELSLCCWLRWVSRDLLLVAVRAAFERFFNKYRKA
jgi:hypothetical protein